MERLYVRYCPHNVTFLHPLTRLLQHYYTTTHYISFWRVRALPRVARTLQKRIARSHEMRQASLHESVKGVFKFIFAYEKIWHRRLSHTFINRFRSRL